MNPATETPAAPPPPARPAARRDRELVRYVGRHGLVAMRHVMAEFGVGRTAAYRRVATCVEAELPGAPAGAQEAHGAEKSL